MAHINLEMLIMIDLWDGEEKVKKVYDNRYSAVPSHDSFSHFLCEPAQTCM